MSTTIAKLMNAFAAAAILAGSLAATDVASARDGGLPDIDARPIFLDTVPPPGNLDDIRPCLNCQPGPGEDRRLPDIFNRSDPPAPVSPHPFSISPGASFRFELGR